MADIAKRFAQNPILQPGDIPPSIAGMKVECLLNPGVFRFNGKTWLLLRVAERPAQKPDITSLPIINAMGQLQILEFDNSDPKLNLSDPRVIAYDGREYLTTMSHFCLVVSSDGINFAEDAAYPPMFGQGELEAYGIEDCRVAQVGDTYHLTFTEVSENGVGVGLRSTTDWRKFVSSGLGNLDLHGIASVPGLGLKICLGSNDDYARDSVGCALIDYVGGENEKSASRQMYRHIQPQSASLQHEASPKPPYIGTQQDPGINALEIEMRQPEPIARPFGP